MSVLPFQSYHWQIARHLRRKISIAADIWEVRALEFPCVPCVLGDHVNDVLELFWRCCHERAVVNKLQECKVHGVNPQTRRAGRPAAV
jgi:hypothetical protein